MLLSHMIFLFFFFFSSRRRHTRLQGDWSSDVCSSDLFDCVEVDSSFYRNPGPAMTKGWYKSTPPAFLFAMKMPKRITHEKKLKGVAENLGWFYASAKELREKCGPLVAQLPPSIKFDSHWIVMQEFLRALEVDKYPH